MRRPILLTLALAAAALALAAPAHALLTRKAASGSSASLVLSADTPHAAPSGPALTLREAYALALDRSEALAVQAQDIEEAKARFLDSFRYFLPDVRFRTSRREQDVREGSGSAEGISSDARRRITPEEKFTFTQPIFSGFKEIAALRASGADRRQQRLEYERAEQLLFVDVMEAYYTALESRRDAEILREISDLLDKRLKELEERVRLGRSRESELKSSLADQRLVQADLTEAAERAAISEDLLSFYIGQEVRGRALADEALPPMPGDTIESYADLAERTRKDVKAYEDGLFLAEQGVLSATAGFLPKAWVEGNYYTRRVGFQNGNDWDALLVLEVPIFDGAQNWSGLKQAAVDKEKARLLLEESRRVARREARSAFRSALLSRQAEEKLGEANTAAKENYDILTAEYRLSLVNNLEVLDALRRYQDINRRYNGAKYRAHREYWRFKSAVGDLS
ncbi:MAG: hypothetical protein MOGMAGMI_00750 [Candidatus Omnitrophica bacterium]|nr:hypothetical protein [Candidatus Omnitrophota bacterium]